MDNSLNQSIIEKVITKNVAIHIALNTMCPPSFEDKFKNESLCQKNTQTQNSEKSLNVVEPNNVNVANDTMNNIKTNSEEKSWRDITDPKLRKKMRKKAWREANKEYHKNYHTINKDKIKLQRKSYYENNKDKFKSRHKSYYENNKEHIKSKTKKYFKLNKNKIYKHRNNRSKNDIQYKLSNNLRKRIMSA